MPQLEMVMTNNKNTYFYFRIVIFIFFLIDNEDQGIEEVEIIDEIAEVQVEYMDINNNGHSGESKNQYTTWSITSEELGGGIAGDQLSKAANTFSSVLVENVENLLPKVFKNASNEPVYTFFKASQALLKDRRLRDRILKRKSLNKK